MINFEPVSYDHAARLIGPSPSEVSRDADLLATVCPIETNQEQFMEHLANHPDTTVRINMDPAVFLPRRHDAAMAEAKRVLDLARCRGNTSVGSLVPFVADPRIIQEVSEFVEASQTK